MSLVENSASFFQPASINLTEFGKPGAGGTEAACLSLDRASKSASTSTLIKAAALCLCVCVLLGHTQSFHTWVRTQTLVFVDAPTTTISGGVYETISFLVCVFVSGSLLCRWVGQGVTGEYGSYSRWLTPPTASNVESVCLHCIIYSKSFSASFTSVEICPFSLSALCCTKKWLKTKQENELQGKKNSRYRPGQSFWWMCHPTAPADTLQPQTATCKKNFFMFSAYKYVE